MKQILLVSALALSVTAVGTWLIPPAYAAKTKTCNVTTDTVSNPPNGNAGFNQTITETQTSACNSNSDTGFDTVEGPVTNKAKSLKPGTTEDAATEKVIAGILKK
jgi:hypothetical protein